MHHVSAISHYPSVLGTFTSSNGALRARDTTSSTDSSDPTSASDLQSTFLTLLSTELENQDPTAPVDSTAMVGQMISLNQLDELVNINQDLTSGSTATTASGAVQKPAASGASSAPLSSAPAMNPASGTNTLPFDPNTMMPAANSPLGVALNSGSNPATLGLSGANSTTTGGK